MTNNFQGGQNIDQSDQKDTKDYSNYNAFYGYEENLFNNVDLDEEDKEADTEYNYFDLYMEERRKAIKEKEEIEKLKQKRSERPTIRQTFSDIRNDLKKMTSRDWEDIPEIKEFTNKKRKLERYTPNTDKQLFSSLKDNELLNTINNNNQNNNSLSSIDNLSKAKNSVLSCVFDKMSDKVSGQTSVNPIGYITEMGSSLPTFTGGDVHDFRKARLLFKNLLLTNPKNASGWIASARLEELDGKLDQARSIITEAANTIFDNEDIWLEAARLHSPPQAKIIIEKALSYIDKSEALWFSLIDFEAEQEKKKKMLRNALIHLPQSEKLWMALVNMENETTAREILRKAVKCVPYSIDMWLALAKLEDYDDAKKTLNKAIKLNPKSQVIWVSAGMLEEANSCNYLKVEKIISKAMDILNSNGVILSKDDWLNEVIKTEKSKAPFTLKAIVHSMIAIEDLKDIQSIEALIAKAKEEKCLISCKEIYLRLLELTDYNSIDLWMKLIQLLKEFNDKQSVENILLMAIDKCPSNELFWLLYSKYKLKNGDIQEAKSKLLVALNVVTIKENIILLIVKLFFVENQYEEAIYFLTKESEAIPNNQRLQKYLIQLYRYSKKYNTALLLVDKAITNYPNYDKLYVIKAQMIIENTNDTKKAIEVYKKGIQENKDSIRLIICLCRLLHSIDKGNNETIIRAILEKALNQGTSKFSEELWNESIMFEIVHNNLSSAKTELAKGLKLIPKSGILWSIAIKMEKGHNKHSKAFEALEKTEHSPIIMMAIGNLYYEEKDIVNARKWYENGIRINRDLGDIWIYYYKAESTIGNHEKAEEILRQCEESEPKHGELWIRIKKQIDNWNKDIKDLIEQAADNAELDINKYNE